MGAVDEDALVLDADGVHFEPIVAGLVRDIPGVDELGDPSVGGPDQVVRRDSGVRVLKPGDGAVVGLLGVMNDDVADVVAVARPVGLVVVAVLGGIGWIGLGVCGRGETAGQPDRALRLIGRLRCGRRPRSQRQCDHQDGRGWRSMSGHVRYSSQRRDPADYQEQRRTSPS